ncbi:hypothetical protein Tco_1081400 [Tanacetum coccineum]|uniref:Uncharacterized protein n=1 Tax=Tanacetum coccineum TaxID=301880 RepID=A0ABQ5HXV3_9ASTR
MPLFQISTYKRAYPAFLKPLAYLGLAYKQFEQKKEAIQTTRQPNLAGMGYGCMGFGKEFVYRNIANYVLPGGLFTQHIVKPCCHIRLMGAEVGAESGGFSCSSGWVWGLKWVWVLGAGSLEWDANLDPVEKSVDNREFITQHNWLIKYTQRESIQIAIAASEVIQMNRSEKTEVRDAALDFEADRKHRIKVNTVCSGGMVEGGTLVSEVNIDNSNITMEEYIKLEEEKARRRGKVYNWETATYGKISCNTPKMGSSGIWVGECYFIDQ